jgi:hypothetical protein
MQNHRIFFDLTIQKMSKSNQALFPNRLVSKKGEKPAFGAYQG